MGLFLFRFWPALIPLLLYVLWFFLVRRKAVMSGRVPPRFGDGPIYWVLISTLLIAALCLAALGVSQQAVKGEYIPPHMDHGRLMPSQVREEP